MAAWALLGAGTHVVEPSGFGLAAYAPGLRIDVVTAGMVGLVSFIGVLIVRFSRRYLGREPGSARYVRWLMATLAAVSLLVLSESLLWLGLAWVGTSLSLHQLLTFFHARPQALIAAHKKFLVSRVADVALWVAIAIVGLEVGSFDIGAVHAWAAGIDRLPLGIELAAVLLVVGACLKCAQLPFHGWLTQVMEAPTPVSALLHAGVVNIGGLLMIRLAPLMMQAGPAQLLLVVMGTFTAVVAALVMMTRVSVKASLAWSTCAQMGFMLIECGLGAYHLAFLHLLAHSFYKAHAFLSSGSIVEAWAVRRIGRPVPRARATSWLGAVALAMGCVYAVGLAFGVHPRQEPVLYALGFVVCLGLTPLLVQGTAGIRGALRVASSAAGVTALYFGWHALFGKALPNMGGAQTFHALMPRLAVVFMGFGALFALQAVMHARPQSRLARALYPLLHAGLYLDEIFTRLTFQLWPAKLPPRTGPRVSTAIEAQEA